MHRKQHFYSNRIMYRLSTKIIAFFFLLIVSVPVLLSLHFLLQEMIIQQEVEEKLKTDVLQSVRVARADITWIRANKEVLLNGELFDVKYVETDNEIITLTGFFDTAETKLLADLKKYTEHSSQDNPASEFSFEFQYLPLYNSYFQITCERDWRSISNQYHSFVAMLPTAPGLPFTHPPRLHYSSFI